MNQFVMTNVDSIPRRELDVYYKLYFEKRTKKEAAQLLGVTINTLNTFLRRLRRRLKGKG